MKHQIKYLMNWYSTLLIICFLSLSFVVNGQNISVKGKVLDARTNESLPGVNIKVEGTNLGTVTDYNGTFIVDVTDNNAVLLFSFVGYNTESVPVKGQTVISISLEPSIESLSEVLVTGYMTQKKADLTGAVGVVDMEDLEDQPSGNAIKNLQGRVAGVTITTDGSPSSGATIRIRGNSTLNNNDPLFVIDGVPSKSGMHELNPDDIESIQILKDASAASIYGSRSANGVVIITTKQASEGKATFGFTANYGMQKYATKLTPLNTYERGLVYFDASVNDKLSPVSPIYNYVWNGDMNNPILGSITYPEYIDAAKTMKPADTKWFDEIAQNSLSQNYNFTAAKGDKNSNVFFSLGYVNNDGIVKETNFQRYNTRINSEIRAFDGKLVIGENFTISYQEETLIDVGNVLFSSLVLQPIVPVYTETGGWGGPVSGMTDRQNPVRLIEDNKQNRYKFSRPFGNAYIQIEPIEGLKLKSSIGIDYAVYYERKISKKYVSGFLKEDDNGVYNSVNLHGNWVWSNTANYSKKFNNQTLDALLGFEQIKYGEEWFNASREGYVSEDVNYAYLGTGSKNMLNNGSGTAWSLQSFFGKVNYSLKDKYLASVTLRRDGSSRFGKNNRYGNFPAASVGWRINEESFIKDNISIPFYLKLRASWGQNGNQEIGDLSIYNVYRAVYGKEDPIWDNPKPPYYMPALGTAYDITGADGGQLPSGYIYSQLGNDNLKWETTTQENFGFDFTVFKNLSGSFDYYIKQTDDILYQKQLLSVVGEGSVQWINGGRIRNSGFEYSLSYYNNLGEFAYDVSANFSTLNNEVVSMPEDLIMRTPNSVLLTSDKFIGHSMRSYYGYVADGLFQNETEVTNHAQQTGKDVGRIRYKDLNGDGVINENDQQFIGVNDPKYALGLISKVEYKNFSLEFFFQGIFGIDVYNDNKTYTDFASLWPGTNWGDRTLDAWTTSNTSSTIPALTTIDKNNEGRVSTYFIESGSYFKLRNVQLGYTLNKNKVSKFGMESVRLYIQGQNLMTIKSKSFTGPDPETANNAFPIPVAINFGVNIKF
ncbi:MAG: TonB-dependent receptor [Salinivirgaceae bacterium]